MRNSLFTIILLANFSFADYSSHPEAKELIDSLVQDHNFERSYVSECASGSKKNKLESLIQCHLQQNLHGHGRDIRNYS